MIRLRLAATTLARLLALTAAGLALPAPAIAANAPAATVPSSLLLAAAADRQAAPRPPRQARPPRAAEASARLGQRDDVLRFADELAARHAIDPGWVRAQLADARRLRAVQALILPAASSTAKNWAAYRDRFVEPQRIDAGLRFWRAHEAALARAEAAYGVPAAIVVGLIGVETYYGRVSGSFRVLDALATLAFDYPAAAERDRSGYFRDELEQLLLWSRREGIDAATPRGSYAGAAGLGQFMPASINRYAVDFDDDGHVDLSASAADAIGSVANYLMAHGWQRGLPVHYDVTPPADDAARAALLAPDIVPSFSPAQMVQAGAALAPAALDHPGLLALVQVHNGDAAPPSYVAGSANFHALTRYNRSSYYALAVTALAAAVQARR